MVSKTMKISCVELIPLHRFEINQRASLKKKNHKVYCDLISMPHRHQSTDHYNTKHGMTERNQLDLLPDCS